MQTNRNDAIDFLKGFSIIAIFLCHYVQVLGREWGLIYHFFYLGQLAVPSFFFFTGYLAYGNVNQTNNYIYYMWNKIKKIIFPWYFTILVTVFFSLAIRNIYADFPYMSNTYLVAIIINILLLNGLVPSANNNVVFGGWFIGTMFVFWLLMPMIKKLTDRYGNRFLIISIFISIIINLLIGLIIGIDKLSRNSFLYFFFITHLSALLIGIYFKKNEISIYNISNSKVMIILTLCSLCSLGLFIFNFPTSAIYQPILIAIVSGCLYEKIKTNTVIIYRWGGGEISWKK